jgi:uncharacterized membrane protein
MSSFPNWHPLVVHFPIALVLSATALLLAARLLRSESVAASAATVGTWNLCLGAAAALVALGSGLSAVLGLDVSAAARQAISVHLKWAMLTTLLLVLLAVWRGAGTASRSRPSWIFLIVLVAASAALSFTAYRGGKNVYEYAVGVRKIAARSFEASRGDPIDPKDAYCAGMDPV